MTDFNSLPIILYADGACKGNPGRGGWGVRIEYPDGKIREFFGGEGHTTNNRMEMMAVINGLKHTQPTDRLEIYSDSSYVIDGLTKYHAGWKQKNWTKQGRDMPNADLWRTLDQLTQGRTIHWHWVRGHNGHAGNERADKLANQGVDAPEGGLLESHLPPKQPPAEPLQEPRASWLLDDPLGHNELDLLENAEPMPNDIGADDTMDNASKRQAEEAQNSDNRYEFIPPTKADHGPRQLILDTETTGFSAATGDRIVEIGVIEMIDRKLTGNKLHVYLNPQRDVGTSVTVHGLTNDFLQDKPLFEHIAQHVYDFLIGGEIIAHNSKFDMSFLDAEFDRAGFGPLTPHVTVTDTLALARRKHGGNNSLDALIKRYNVPSRNRDLHGALLDAELLTDVYLAMTGGQALLEIDNDHTGNMGSGAYKTFSNRRLAVIQPTTTEIAAHDAWLDDMQGRAIWPKP